MHTTHHTLDTTRNTHSTAHSPPHTVQLQATFEKVRVWYTEFVEGAGIDDPTTFPFVLIGNKADCDPADVAVSSLHTHPFSLHTIIHTIIYIIINITTTDNNSNITIIVNHQKYTPQTSKQANNEHNTPHAV